MRRCIKFKLRLRPKLYQLEIAFDTNEWLRVTGAFVPVVDGRLFAAVQGKLAESRRRPTRSEIIEGMRKVISRTGRISQKLLKHYRSAPSAEQVAHEFGSLNEAYKVIGYAPNLDPERSENRCVERNMERRVADSVTAMLRDIGHDVRYEKHTTTLCIDGALRMQLVVRRPWMIQGHLPYWTARWPDCFAIDFLVYGRIERTGTELLDFHILPRGSLPTGEYTVVFRHGQSHFEPYRRPDLKALLALADTVSLDVLPAVPSSVAR